MDVLTINNLTNSYFNVNYSFDVSQKAVILDGDSATGKSLLFTIFRNQISREYPVIPVDTETLFNSVDITKGSSFIVIDRFDVWGNDKYRKCIDKAIYSSNNKFIIISRYFGFAVSEHNHKNVVYKDRVLQLL